MIYPGELPSGHPEQSVPLMFLVPLLLHPSRFLFFLNLWISIGFFVFFHLVSIQSRFHLIVPCVCSRIFTHVYRKKKKRRKKKKKKNKKLAGTVTVVLIRV